MAPIVALVIAVNGIALITGPEGKKGRLLLRIFRLLLIKQDLEERGGYHTSYSRCMCTWEEGACKLEYRLVQLAGAFTFNENG